MYNWKPILTVENPRWKTPEEFVAAGDHLVATCPTWSWQAGEADKTKAYLPVDKQFLITKQVPCYKRCKDIQYTGEHEQIVDDGEDGGKYFNCCYTVVDVKDFCLP